MKKNVASQSIGCQMITAADGTAFTGTVTAYKTIDGGTQAIGTVGSGVCTHEGNGYHSYAPAQAETNGDHIAWTFIGTGAIPATIQVYTGFPQSVDNNVLAAGATGFAAIDTVVDAIKAKTDNLPSDPADQSLVIAATDALATLINGLEDLSAAQVNAELVDVLATDTYPESSGVPAATSSLKDAIVWLRTYFRNKMIQTDTTQTLRNDADSADIATATHTKDATTHTRGEWS